MDETLACSRSWPVASGSDRHTDDLMDGGGLWHGPHAPLADTQDCADPVRTGVLTERAPLSPSADLPACRDEDPAHAATLAACYPDPPEYQHPEEPEDD